MRINFKLAARAFSYLILFAFFSAACRFGENTNQTPVNNTATPARKLNGERLSAMDFRAWLRSAPGMILDKDGYESAYLAAPGAKPAPFNEYEIKRYPDNSKLARSHSGKFEVRVNSFNERTKQNACCAVQEFDYEVVVSEVTSRANKTKLSDENWNFKGWSPDDKFLLFSAAPEVFLIDAETGEKISIFSDKDMWRFAFERNGRGLFIIDRSDETTRLEYLDFAARQLTTMLAPLKSEPEISVSPDGKKLALFSKIFTGDTTLTADNFLYLFDAESKALIREYSLPKGVIYDYSGWRDDGREIGFTVWSENYARSVYSVSVEDGETTLWYPPAGETTGLYK